MTLYEIIYCMLRFHEKPLYNQINKILKANTRSGFNLLDVGGRTSPYTIGIKCNVFISELPRIDAVQEKLKLGLDNNLERRIRNRRSNVKNILYDDMVHSSIEDKSFEVITAIEVLEHVEQDIKFIQNVAKKLKRKGVFIMSTPNGDYIKEVYEDHKRHYKKEDLEKILLEYFTSVDVFYSVVENPFSKLSYKIYSRLGKIPGIFLGGFFSFLSRLQSSQQSVRTTPKGTLHLVAVCIN